MEQPKNHTTTTPVVSIICLTYNHAPYIRECLDGFLMQKTDFPFEVIIHDDASTDGTTDIIREYAAKYPAIIKPIIQTENQYSKHHNFGYIMESCFQICQGQFIAYCEGDDYWIDPLKIQKQVTFLINNKEFGLVHTNVYVAKWNNNFKKSIYCKTTVPEGNVYPEILSDNFLSTLSVLFRRELTVLLQNEVCPIPYWDRIMWTCFSRHTKFHFLEDYTAVYRVLENSATHGAAAKVLDTEEQGTVDFIEFLRKNRISDNEMKLFLIPRYRKLLRLSYFAKKREKVIDYWNLIRTLVRPTIYDSIFYIFSRFRISPSLLKKLVNIKSRI